MSTPIRWPTDIRYIDTQLYDPSVSRAMVSYISGSDQAKAKCARHTGKASGTRSSKSTGSMVVIRNINDSLHPAKGQKGLFANRKIPPCNYIMDYLGEVHSDDRPDSDYDLSLYKSVTAEGIVDIGIDATRMGNEARFINDYRGIKPKPNAIFKEGRTIWGELRMSIWSDNEPIRKGEEILVTYGKSWWRARKCDDAPDGGQNVS